MTCLSCKHDDKISGKETCYVADRFEYKPPRICREAGRHVRGFNFHTYKTLVKFPLKIQR